VGIKVSVPSSQRRATKTYIAVDIRVELQLLKIRFKVSEEGQLFQVIVT
jgi:hypothetical protein